MLVAFGSTVMQSYSELKETVPSLLVPLNVSVFGVQDKRFIEEYQEIAGLANGRLYTNIFKLKKIYILYLNR